MRCAARGLAEREGRDIVLIVNTELPRWGEVEEVGSVLGAIQRTEDYHLLRLLYARLLDTAPAARWQPREGIIYLHEIPDRDAWGERIEVYYEQEKLLTGRVVTVRSSGANRRFDADAYEVGAFLPGAATDDIVISDRRFVRWPWGVAEGELEVTKKP